MSAADTPVEFVGSSKKDLSHFPKAVRDHVGFALWMAQRGEKHDSTKPLKGFGGASVMEIVSDHDGGAYRSVYTVKVKGVIYVLHCFEKKSKSGNKTPASEMNVIETRLRRVLELHRGS
jgi:phage-related protein